MPPKERKPLGRGKSLAQALDGIYKKRGLRVASLDDLALDVESVSTGNLVIDELLGVGGLPKGRLIEFYGFESSGKTTCALQAAVNVQRAGGTTVFFDYEYSLDPMYCKALGLDIEAPTFLTAQPESFEQGMNALRELIETGEIDLAIVDSVAAMPIEKELEIETGGSTFADKAKMMAQAMRQLTGSCSRTGTIVIFLNHLQEAIPSGRIEQQMASRGIKQKTTPGGRALKYQASVRVEFKLIGNKRGTRIDPLTNQEEDFIIENKVLVNVVKNKVAPPYRHAEVRVRFGHGFSPAWSLVQVLIGHGVVHKGSGGIFKFSGDVKLPDEGLPEGKDHIKGEDNLVAFVESNPEWMSYLDTLARDILKGSEKVAEEKLDVDQETGEITVATPSEADDDIDALLA